MKRIILIVFAVSLFGCSEERRSQTEYNLVHQNETYYISSVSRHERGLCKYETEIPNTPLMGLAFIDSCKMWRIGEQVRIVVR